MRKTVSLFGGVLCAMALAGCAGDGGPAAAPTATPTRTVAPTDTATPSPTFTLSPSPTDTATVPPTATATPVPPTDTPVPPTATSTATASPSSTTTPTDTPLPTATPTSTATASATPTDVVPVEVDPQLFEELEAVQFGQYLGRPVPEPTTDGPWLRYDFATSDDGPICLYGTPYQVYVRPGTSENVLFYLEGGGACWNNRNCWNNTRAKIDANPLLPLQLLRGGIFSPSPQFNPLAGWTVIYVPYCDGSVFTGDNVADYEQGTVWHRGLSNLSTGVDVMKSLYPNPPRIVVSGSSAGGFGTFSGYGVMRLAYPTTEILVLNDSGPGLQNNDDPEALADRRENWQFEKFRPESCPDCIEQPTFLTNWAMSFDPRLRGGFFSSLQDEVIRGFLELSGPEYQELLVDVTGRVVGRNPDRAKRFLAEGDFHTIMLGGGLSSGGVAADYRSIAIDGTTLPTWIQQMLDNDPAWSDLVDGR